MTKLTLKDINALIDMLIHTSVRQESDVHLSLIMKLEKIRSELKAERRKTKYSHLVGEGKD